MSLANNRGRTWANVPETGGCSQGVCEYRAGRPDRGEFVKPGWGFERTSRVSGVCALDESWEGLCGGDRGQTSEHGAGDLRRTGKGALLRRGSESKPGLGDEPRMTVRGRVFGGRELARSQQSRADG